MTLQQMTLQQMAQVRMTFDEMTQVKMTQDQIPQLKMILDIRSNNIKMSFDQIASAPIT